MNQYLKIFPKENILRLDFKELKTKPKNIIKKISLFLKVNDIDKYKMKFYKDIIYTKDLLVSLYTTTTHPKSYRIPKELQKLMYEK